MVSHFKSYHPNWSWNHETEAWLQGQVTGLTLNICSGMSQTGDIRADLDPAVKPTIICDVDHPPFRELSVDTLVCDPPFSKYNRFKWISNLAHIPRKRLILSSPAINIHLGRNNWTHDYHLTVEGKNIFLRVWQIYNRRNHTLRDYGGNQ